MNINSSLKNTPIAVVGMSALFADASNLEEFWTNIVQAKDSIKEVPDSRWKIEDYYDPDFSAPDKTYCKRGGFLPSVDFNPMEFGLPPNILEVTDASQLLALVAARDAFQDAGYGKDSEKFTAELKAKTGVLLGVGGGQKLITPLIARLQYPIWEKALRSSGIAESDIPSIVDKMKKAYIGWNENSFPGLLGNVISGRITNRFDLGGINSVVDAACAASLSAIKMSLSELVEGRCDMMLTGGVDTDNSPFMYMSFSKTPAFSRSGNISPFSDKADGMLIGEGVGMIVLKRLADAERDNDNIYAVITGVGTSSDGRYKSVYAPRSSGQALAMSRAYEDAGYDPSTVGLLEAHGTGTGAGDPTEFNSMQMVFGKENPKKQHIALGSVKSQIGHTKAAAGAAGMIKAILAVHHKVLPPTINVEQPNSKFDIENTAIYINTETRPWMKNGAPRRAGVSAFGFGGINVHIALEEYHKKQGDQYRLHQPYKGIIFSESSPEELQKLCVSALRELNSTEGDNMFDFFIEKSNKQKVKTVDSRVGFVVSTKEECIERLTITIENLKTNSENWTHPKGIYYRKSGVNLDTSKVVALFSGQGSQYVGMGKELLNAFPELRHTFEQANNQFTKEGLKPISEIVYPIPVFNAADKKQQQNNLTKTQNAQPAIGTLSMGLYKIFQRTGFTPSFTAGHSFGELTALWAAGVYDDETFLALSKARGQAMAQQNPGTDSGTMLAVKAPATQVAEAIKNIPGVSIANINSTSQVVLGGSTSAIENAIPQLKAQGLTVIPLPVSAAFHTDLVKHAQAPFAAFVHKQKFNKATATPYSNTTAQPYPANLTQVKTILKDHILNPVNFKEQVENIHTNGGRIFVEFGPKGVLTNLVKDILKDKEHFAIAVNANAKKNSDLQIREAYIQLQVLGLPVSQLDIYKKPAKNKPAPSKLNVRISGNNFVSQGTQKAYTDVLNNGFKISGGQTQIVEKIIEVEKKVAVPVASAIPQNNEEEMINKETLQLLQNTVSHFQDHQRKSMEIFEKMMTDQNAQAKDLISLLSNQLNEGNAVNGVSSIASNSIAAPVFKKNGSANGSSNGNGSVKTMPAVTTVQAPVSNGSTVTAPVAQKSNGLNNTKLEAMLLAVVSEKTGYPAEMLELNMDMEADLGIDSIKRVEIFGALTAQYPEMSGIDPNELTELRTLGEIVSYVGKKAGGNIQQTVATPVATPVQVATPSPTSTGTVDNSEMEKMLLQVVSEKTGYPAEMLEMNMDMEADLGIDSIKRVEIFGALTAQYPGMAGIDPNELTELRTLGEIVSYVGAKTGANPSQNGSTTSTAKPVAVQAIPTAPTAPQNGMDSSKMEKMLLAVVSEKTGYPAEMLEMNMDMEADLGIDSIKRVEIFGALTAQYPEMAGIDPNELTELRTLGEIVTYVGQKTGIKSNGSAAATNTVVSAPTPIAPAAVSSNGTGAIDNAKLQEMLLAVVSEKTGYPAEMLELNMDMEADLGIDSIKRVEIFGALTAQYPEMSGIDPNELTELRTLGEIVTYVSAKVKKKILS